MARQGRRVARRQPQRGARNPAVGVSPARAQSRQLRRLAGLTTSTFVLRTLKATADLTQRDLGEGLAEMCQPACDGATAAQNGCTPLSPDATPAVAATVRRLMAAVEELAAVVEQTLALTMGHLRGLLSEVERLAAKLPGPA